MGEGVLKRVNYEINTIHSNIYVVMEGLDPFFIILKDKEGKTLEKSRIRLLSLPRLTNRNTLIYNGNEYNVANQIRLKPGVYTNTGDDGVTRSQFNVGKYKVKGRILIINYGIIHCSQHAEKCQVIFDPILMAAEFTQIMHLRTPTKTTAWAEPQPKNRTQITQI